MKQVLASALAVAVSLASSGTGPQEDRAPATAQDLARIEKRLDELEALVRANREALDRLLRRLGPDFVVPAVPLPPAGLAPAFPVPAVPFPSNALVPDPGAPGELLGQQWPNFIVPPGPQPWIEPAPYFLVTPNAGPLFDPERALGGTWPTSYDRCLIMVDPAAYDPHFVVRVPHVGARMIVAPRVVGLPLNARTGWPGRRLGR
jgi:hypothetical protein